MPRAWLRSPGVQALLALVMCSPRDDLPHNPVKKLCDAVHCPRAGPHCVGPGGTLPPSEERRGRGLRFNPALVSGNSNQRL
ncbi:unnamed protein product [Gadus morhua 'NCC']